MRILVVLLLSVCAGLANAETTYPIAVIDLTVVFNNAKVFHVQIAAMKVEQEKAQAELKDMEEAQKQVASRLEVLNPDNPSYHEVHDQLELLKLKQKLFFDETQSHLDRMHLDVLKKTYALVRRHLKEFSQEHGYKLVLLDAEDSVGNTPEDLRMMLHQSVLYADVSTLDITKPFLAYLNSNAAADEATITAATGNASTKASGTPPQEPTINAPSAPQAPTGTSPGTTPPPAAVQASPQAHTPAPGPGLPAKDSGAGPQLQP